MDWFEQITGFSERGYRETQARLSVHEGHLVSTHNEHRWRVGTLETPSLSELRARAAPALDAGRRTTVRIVQGDVRGMHAQPEHAGALFQVASQFNLLEMTHFDVSPEHGVTRYAGDPTQGPACAMAAGAATIYRNYLLPFETGLGQTSECQVDTLADLGRLLGNSSGRRWSMRNGYSLFTRDGLAAVDHQLADQDEAGLDRLRSALRIGLHWAVDVTDAASAGQAVSQAFCSALPVSYNSLPGAPWERFATLVLEAAYEATLLAAVLNRPASPTVFLTLLGGGAFGNDRRWILKSLSRALRRVPEAGLDVVLVSYGQPAVDLVALVQEMNALTSDRRS